MTFKTMKHLYSLLVDEIMRTEKQVEKLRERVAEEKAKLDSCWDESDELNYWKDSLNSKIDHLTELNQMLEDMENSPV